MRMGRALGVVSIALVFCASGLLGVVSGHGATEDPISRVYRCYLENPESPTSAACQAAVALSGTEAFLGIAWSGVLANAAGQPRQLIPDGQLCSAGQELYAGLDLPRADWPATSLSSGVDFTYLYKKAIAHPGYFEFYITRDGYEPTEPLKWSDLEDSPFLTVPDPPYDSSRLFYEMPGTTPAGKSGRHLIYVIWQRTDSPEAFYSCSDVDFPSSLIRTSAS